MRPHRPIDPPDINSLSLLRPRPPENQMNREQQLREIRERYRAARHALNEVTRRQWAAAEAQRLGRGGLTLVSLALHMSRSTIRRGIRELADDPTGLPTSLPSRLRRPGGGRKMQQSR